MHQDIRPGPQCQCVVFISSTVFQPVFLPPPLLSHYFDSYSAFLQLLIFFRFVGHVLRVEYFLAFFIAEFLLAFCGSRLLLPSNIRLFLHVHPCEEFCSVSAFFYNTGVGQSLEFIASTLPLFHPSLVSLILYLPTFFALLKAKELFRLKFLYFFFSRTSILVLFFKVNTPFTCVRK